MKAYRIVLFFVFCSVFLISQEQRQIDSLKALIPKLTTDTARIRNYLLVAEWIADIDEWSVYNNKALEIVNKIYDETAEGELKQAFKKYKADALNNLGLYYKEKGNYEMALENYDKSLELQKQIKNTEGVAVTLVNIAAIEIARGKTIEGIQKNSEALKIFRDQLHDKAKT